MLKKITAVLISVLLIVSIMPVSIFAAETTSGTTGDCTWTLDGTVLTISGNGKMRDYRDYYDGYVFGAPWGRNITEVIIKEGVTSIGDSAFYGCTDLTNVTIGSSVTSIGGYAFSHCTSLTSITIPDSVTSIVNSAFKGCTGLTSATIGDSVTSIGSSAFEGCTGLISVTIGNGVTSIGSEAFSDCIGLTIATIGNGVTSIGSEAFSGCTGLKEVHISSIEKWCSINFGNSYANPLRYAHDLYLNGEKIVNLVIPDSVTSIGDCAFFGCTGLTSATIGNGVTSIGDSAFKGCTGLTSITIGDNVTSIGYQAFYGCTGLTSATIGNGVTSIKDNAFKGCNIKELIIADGSKTVTSTMVICRGTLEKVSIPDSVTIIDTYAFYGCTDLTSVTIPDSVTSIGNFAFEGCTGLTSITIPDSVTSIGKYAFYDCTGLTSIIIPSSVTSIGERAFSGCDKSKLIIYTDSMAATAYKYAKDNGYRCVVLLNNNDEIGFSIDGNTLTVIGTGKMPNYNLFTSTPWHSAKDSIKRVIVDSRITEVGTYSFYGFDNLKELVCENANLKLGTRAINTDNKNIRVYSLSGGSLEKYCSDNSVNFVSPLDAPILVSVTGNSITVKAADGVKAEFSLDGVNWQRSGQFNSLQPVTEYKVYSRRYNEYSPIASEPLVVKTKKSTVSAPGAPTIEEYSVNKVTLKAISGYEYSCDGGLTWQSSNVFEGIAQNKIYEFCVRKAETETVFASEKSAALYFALPKMPEIERIGATTLTLKAVDGFEYSLDKIEWQTSPHFTGLINSMTYTVYQRISGSQYSNSYQLISSGTDVCINGTDKTTPAKPSTPIVASKTSSSVTLKATEGYEYSLDGKVWHSSNVFDGLKDDTEYTFYQRIAETETSYASECSAGLKVKTDKAYTAGELDGDGKITDKDAIYLLMHCYFPGDYPVEQPCDYNGDGIINDKDAVYLLMHCYFPNDYPITK